MSFALSTSTCAQGPYFSSQNQENIVVKDTSAEIIWYDVKDLDHSLFGFEWLEQDKAYRRLPIHPSWSITQDVDELANHTAGGQLRFKTNSNKIFLRVELAGKSGMYHMPPTGQSGFDLYVEKNNRQIYHRTSRFPHDTIRYQLDYHIENGSIEQNVTVNFPLYNGVKSVIVGIEKGSFLNEPRPFSLPGKIVIYGTSITQGGCVSRPGMAYSNILSRKLDTEFINLGFSGNGKGEPALAHLINQVSNIGMIILDYEANADQTIQNTISEFVDILRTEHPKMPVLIMSKTRYASAIDGSESYKLLMSNRDFQKNLVQNKKNNGDENIYFLDGSKVLGDDYHECTVDGSHPSDLGSYRISNALFKTIKGILKP